MEQMGARAASVYALLAVIEPGLAMKELKSMSEMDEDATITQWPTAWGESHRWKGGTQDAFTHFPGNDRQIWCNSLSFGWSIQVNLSVTQGQGECRRVLDVEFY
ncbi:unnamed protein product, partial [Mesorhabditis belari]|uniref:Uncharacterized protein n=1 Tax=Mesorhabditis belari TaxID=2138241 RepID=A0AAF3JBZ0_9BILA